MTPEQFPLTASLIRKFNDHNFLIGSETVRELDQAATPDDRARLFNFMEQTLAVIMQGGKLMFRITTLPGTQEKTFSLQNDGSATVYLDQSEMPEYWIHQTFPEQSLFALFVPRDTNKHLAYANRGDRRRMLRILGSVPDYLDLLSFGLASLNAGNSGLDQITRRAVVQAVLLDTVAKNIMEFNEKSAPYR